MYQVFYVVFGGKLGLESSTFNIGFRLVGVQVVVKKYFVRVDSSLIVRRKRNIKKGRIMLFILMHLLLTPILFFRFIMQFLCIQNILFCCGVNFKHFFLWN